MYLLYTTFSTRADTVWRYFEDVLGIPNLPSLMEYDRDINLMKAAVGLQTGYNGISDMLKRKILDYVVSHRM